MLKNELCKSFTLTHEKDFHFCSLRQTPISWGFLNKWGVFSNKGNKYYFNADIHSHPVNIFTSMHYTAVWDECFIRVGALLGYGKPTKT